jgi:hypothetical protein
MATGSGFGKCAGSARTRGMTAAQLVAVAGFGLGAALAVFFRWLSHRHS